MCVLTLSPIMTKSYMTPSGKLSQIEAPDRSALPVPLPHREHQRVSRIAGIATVLHDTQLRLPHAKVS
jgi:hypothetical protein